MPFDALKLDGRGWHGTTKDGRLQAWITPSGRHPGFYHYQVCDLKGSVEDRSIRPVKPEFVLDFCSALGPVQQLTWDECTWRIPDDLPRGLLPLPGVVYFIGAGPFVKIGKATGSPGGRMDQLQTGCPFPMVILATFPGGINEERQFHKRFRAHHFRGEWFRNEGAVAQFISELTHAV